MGALVELFHADFTNLLAFCPFLLLFWFLMMRWIWSQARFYFEIVNNFKSKPRFWWFKKNWKDKSWNLSKIFRFYSNYFFHINNKISLKIYKCLKDFVQPKRNFDVAEKKFFICKKMAKFSIFPSLVIVPKGNF